MTVTQIIRRSNLAPADLKILLSANPSPQAIEQFKHQLDLISTKLLERSNLCEGTKYVSLTGGVLTLLAAVSTGGIGAGVCAVVSGIGALSAWWHSGEISHQSEDLLEFTVKLSNLIEGVNSTRLAGLWQLVGVDEFWHFLTGTVAASDEYADGLKVRARVDGRVRLLDPNQGTCYRFAEAYGMTPKDLLDKLDNLDRTLPSATTVPVPALPTESSNPLPAVTDSLKVQPQTPTPIVQSQPASIPVAPTAYSTLISNPFLSRAVFGAQRSGKSYLLAVATQELALERGVKIFHINLASYGDEDARYWGHAIKSVRCDLPSLDSYQAQYFTDRAIECVHEFFNTRNAILICDEIVLTGSLSNQHFEIVAPFLKLVADKISCLASTGIKRAQAIWTASPDFVAGASSQDCKALKSLSLCFVAIAPGKSVIWNGNPVKFHQESFENVKRNFPSLTYPEGKWKGDRICFVDGQWRELGELPVLREISQNPQPVIKTVEIAQQLEALYERSESLPINPIADWDNGYVADDESLIEILDAIERKYGKDPFNPSEFYRNTSNKQRNLFGGKIDNFRALLYRAIQENLAIVEEDSRGTILIRLS